MTTTAPHNPARDTTRYTFAVFFENNRCDFLKARKP
jgi:hypothetical protein